MALSPARSDSGALGAASRPHHFGRAVTSVSRHGLRGTARRVRDWGLAPLWRRVYLREEHTWISIPVWPQGERMPDGFQLRQGTVHDLEALAAIGGIAPATGRRYLERGARLYVATCGGELAFTTWVHTGTVPALAARGGELELPDGVVSFEDSLVAPAHRRSGIASAVVHEVTAREARAGATLMITRVAADNEPALKWSRKMGHTPVATVRLRRLLGWQHVGVEPLPGGEAVAQLLAERL